MSQVSLSLDQSPALSVPVRFFLTAPLFGIAAAITLFQAGPSALTSRWVPVLLSTTHLLVLGFIAMVMIGAMLQLLPVLAATPVKKTELVSSILHALLSTGVIMLGVGLAGGYQWPMQLALLLLGMTFVFFMVTVITTLRNSASTHASIKTMRLAVVALAVTVMLGVFLGAGHGWSGIVLAREYTNLHLVWGLLGWVGLLTIGLAYQVVPMFQMTPEYPQFMQRWLTPLLLLLLLVWSWGQIGLPLYPVLDWIITALLFFGFGCFSVWTMYLQIRRRRKVADVTVWFWRLGMLSLLVCIVLWAAALLTNLEAHFPLYSLVLGILMIIGFAISVINGMMYKILPFLIWVHLQKKAHDRETRRMIPNVKKILSYEHMRLQFLLHLIAYLLFLSAIWWSQSSIIYLAATCFALSCLMLWVNLLNGLRAYRSCIRQMKVKKLAT